MSTIKLMLPAVLAASIAGPMAASAAETKAPQPPASTGIRVPFLHGFLSGDTGGQSKLTSLARANEFAGAICAIPGAVPRDLGFYDQWMRKWR